MAFWCIDPVDGNDGTGSSQATQALAETTPFKTWAAVTWAQGDSYLQKRGTTATEEVTLTTFGTSANPIYIGAYGTGQKPIIDAENTRGYCLQRGGAEYIIMEDFVCKNATDSAVRFSQSALRDCSGMVVRRVEAYDNGQNGIYFFGAEATNPFPQATGIVIEKCVASGNGRHGISINIGWDDLLITRCFASDNAKTQNGWGIYAAPKIGKYNSADWSNITNVDIATDIWQRTIGNANLAQEAHTNVVADGRTNAAETTAEYWLTEGTFGALSPNEWARSGASMQLVIGQDPNNKAISYANAVGENGVIEFCIVTNHGNAGGGGDGVGIGFDHCTKNSIIRHCVVDCNGDGGVGFSQNIPDACEFINCIALNAGIYGFRINTPKPSTVNKITNCAGITCDTDTFYTRFLNTNRYSESNFKTPATSELSSSYTININSDNLLAQGAFSSDSSSGSFPQTYNGEPLPGFDRDIGANQSTFGPFHPKNL